MADRTAGLDSLKLAQLSARGGFITPRLRCFFARRPERLDEAISLKCSGGIAHVICGHINGKSSSSALLLLRCPPERCNCEQLYLGKLFLDVVQRPNILGQEHRAVLSVFEHFGVEEAALHGICDGPPPGNPARHLVREGLILGLYPILSLETRGHHFKLQLPHRRKHGVNVVVIRGPEHLDGALLAELRHALFELLLLARVGVADPIEKLG